jgi:putative transcriptional regulator
MATVKYTLDPANPPRISREARARLEAMTDEEISAAAESDPDNPPLTDEEIVRIRAIRIAKRARERAGMTQAAFAEAYRVNLARLRDIEQGRKGKAPDPVLVSFLALVADDPERARRVVAQTR